MSEGKNNLNGEFLKAVKGLTMNPRVDKIIGEYKSEERRKSRNASPAKVANKAKGKSPKPGGN